MDFAAVRMASDSDFQALGIRRRGDIIALRTFVLSDEDYLETEKEAKKRKLPELTKQLASKSLKKKPGTPGLKGKLSEDAGRVMPRTQRLKKIQIGWMHYNEKDRRFVAVCMTKGGGTREVSLPLESTSEEVMEAMKGIFFFRQAVRIWKYGPDDFCSRKL